jgi:hypothetical protein
LTCAQSPVNDLGDDDAGGSAGARQQGRGGDQFGQVAALHGERADGVGLALIDVQAAAVRAQPRVDRGTPVPQTWVLPSSLSPPPESIEA